MLDRGSFIFSEIEHDLYEEDGYIFGVELDLFNGHIMFYCKYDVFYYDLPNDVVKAIDEFNKILEEKPW